MQRDPQDTVTVEQAAFAEIEKPQLLESRLSRDGFPNASGTLLTLFLEYRPDQTRATKDNEYLDFVGGDSQLYVFSAVILFWLYVKHISPWQALFCVVLIAAGFHLFVNYIALLFLEDDVKWIRKESRLLDAIVKDANKIMDLSVEIENSAREVWGPDQVHSDEVNVAPSASEVAWVRKTKDVVEKAQEFVMSFEIQKRRELIFERKYFPIKLTFMEVEKLFQETRRVKEEVNDIIIAMKNEGEIHICESLEKSWTVIRKLLDRPIDENKWVNSKLQVGADGLISSLIMKLMLIKNLDLGGRFLLLQNVQLQLMLLNPFLQCIKGFQLESEIEKAWLKELDSIAGEAEVAIDTFTKATAHEYKCRLQSPNLMISSWKARRKLTADLKCIDADFSSLFQRKEKYGFKFILRDSSKSTHKHREANSRAKISQLVTDISHYCSHQGLSHLGWVSNKLESLCKELQDMQNLLDYADPTVGINNPRDAWSKQMENIANMAAESKNSFRKNSGGFYYRWQNIKARQQLSREIDQIKHRIYLLERSMRAYRFELREESCSTVGLEEDVKAVLSRLSTAEITDHQVQDYSNNVVVTIVGMEGIGKTTLARKIYGHEAVVGGFRYHKWVNVPQNCNDEFSFLEAVGKQVLDQHNLRRLREVQEPENNAEQHLLSMIRNFLHEKNYFLVLDNVSTTEAWDTLKQMFSAKSDGSRILLTTRNKDVALAADPSGDTLYQLRSRTYDESLSLLKQIVYVSSKEERLACQDFASRCFGLPLSIVRVGYMMLKSNATVSKALLTVPLILKPDTELLPLHLKKLVEHLELFPKDFEISSRRLYTLWVAEELVRPEQRGEEKITAEQVAEKYLYELIGYGVVQIVKKKESGKVKTCRFSLRGKQQHFPLHDDSPEKTVISVQRLAPDVNNNHLRFCVIESNRPTHYNTRKDDELGEDMSFFLRKGINRSTHHDAQVDGDESREDMNSPLRTDTEGSTHDNTSEHDEGREDMSSPLLSRIDGPTHYNTGVDYEFGQGTSFSHWLGIDFYPYYNTELEDDEIREDVSLSLVTGNDGSTRYNTEEEDDDDKLGEDMSFFLQTGIDSSPDHIIRLDYSKLRSFLYFDPREGDAPGERVGNFLRKGIERGEFQQLKVLDLERVFRPELPNNIGKLKRLRYLGLRWTYLQSIPKSIGDLAQLETLDVKHTYVHTLPSSVWKLQRLRHLYLNQSNRSKFKRQPKGSFLNNLETLWGVFVDKDSPLKDCLHMLINLRKLGLALQLDVPEQRTLLAKQIAKLEYLHTLRLRSIDETGKPHMLFFEIPRHENFFSIELFGMLENRAVISRFPQKLTELTELTLSGSGLYDPMPTLGKLQNLKLLCFYSKSFEKTRMSCSQGDFPQLLVLKFWKIENLEEWNIEEKALQNLRELEIRYCKKLKIPDGLKNLKNLLELKLTNMPDEFTWKIESEKRQIWNHPPSIKIRDNW